MVDDNNRFGRFQPDRISTQFTPRGTTVRKQRIPIPPSVHLRRRPLPIPAGTDATSRTEPQPFQERPLGYSRRRSAGKTAER